MANTGNGQAVVFATDLTANDSAAKEELGAIRIEYDATYGKKMYMYVRCLSAATAGQSVIGYVASGYSGFGVTVDTTAANVAHKKVWGVAVGTITATYYGWIQVRGHSTKILVAPALCTSANVETYYLSGGVFSINKCTYKCACVPKVEAGIYTYTKTAAGKSTSGYIHCF
jgi:hypothetical protein